MSLLLARLRSTMHETFRFIVLVGNVPYGAFTEASLPVVAFDMEDVKEGGLNSYPHKLPGRRKEASVTLKNGIGGLLLLEWYISNMMEDFERKNVTIVLKTGFIFPTMTWHIEDAFPSEWSGPQLKSGENSVAIQTLKFTCGEVTIIPSPMLL